MSKVKRSQLAPTNYTFSVSIVGLILLYLITLVMKDLLGGGQEKKWLPLGFKRCGGDGTTAYTLPDVQYIIICQDQIQDEDDTVPDRDKDYSMEDIEIDEIKSATSGVLFHEFFHLTYDHISEFSF
jgi:hypothetical protein